MNPAAAPYNPDVQRSSARTARKVASIYVRPYLPQLAVALFLMAVSAVMTALLAQLMQPVLDDVLYGQREELIIPVSAAVFGTFFVRGITTYLHTLSMNKIGQGVVADIQRDLFNHFVTLDLTFFHANPSGQLISRVVNDVSVMRMALTETMTGFGKSAFTLLFLFILMLYQDWKLTLAACLVVPFVSVFLIKVGKRLRSVSGSIQDQMASLSDLLSQSFQGIRMVKAYGMEEKEKSKIGEAIGGVRDLNIKSVHIRNLTTPVNETVLGLIFSLIIAYGGYQVLAGQTTAGGLASFLAAFTLAYEPMKKLARLNGNLQMGLGAADRVFELMDLTPSIISKPDAQELKVESPEIVFDDVHFTYAGEIDAALRGVSFTAKQGRVTALVGPSGGGKSTIINLIPRFYDVSEGAICVDGKDIRDLTLESLRGHIALVSQDITIFNDTIYENIRYGKAEASEAEIRAAAEAAAAHEFITAFPRGYETLVGEDGIKLSGGQRQRIAIARAILKDAPILLLDEATSALDNESEKLVQKALQALEKGRTTIVIAHRLTTVQAADQILVLDRGEIVERGTHDNLLQEGGLYAKMYETGMKG
ncbi:MAG: ATP-binding cassette domain-containing protein [Alphaproteobacteria bacterium]|nr:ATP-binding cassette domain-containing protein [Alphaproteobacteria bacterium]